MLRRPALTGCLALLGALAAACSSDPEPAPRPNVVLIVVDTLRADHVFDADDSVATPRIDELARDGVAFPNAFSHASWTLPSHTALFSSRQPSQTGVLLNAQRVPDDLPLLAEHLAERGYATEAVVSLCSLIPAGELIRLDRGFERFDDRMHRVMNQAEDAIGNARAAVERLAADPRPFFLFAHFADPHQPYTAHGTVARPADVFLGDDKIGAVPNLAGFAPFRAKLALAPGENTLTVRAPVSFTVRYVGAQTTDGERIEARFVDHSGATEREVVLVNDTDAPVDADLELWAWDDCDEPEARRRYRLEVEYLDRYVGELLDDLRERGLYDDSLIVFTADHGEGLGEHGLLDHGLSCFDEQIHVPLIVKPPAGDPRRAGLADSARGLARHVDVAPTILHALDVPMLAGGTGSSLFEPAERVLLAETHALGVEDNFALRDLRWKLFHGRETGSFVLFDLQADPDELRPILEIDEARFAPWMERLRDVAASSPDAANVNRDADDETRARMKAMGYF